MIDPDDPLAAPAGGSPAPPAGSSDDSPAAAPDASPASRDDAAPAPGETVEIVFADLGLRPELLDALTALGYEEPTPIQREAIPHLIAGRDLVGQAATGTGKTAAFALPILQALEPEADGAEGARAGSAQPSAGGSAQPSRGGSAQLSRGGSAPLSRGSSAQLSRGSSAQLSRGGSAPGSLVLVPTRELAVQVSEALLRYGRGLSVRVVPVFGGQPIGRQLHALGRGVQVVVATPGRALDHLRRGSLSLAEIRTVVLDEADEMLDMGFSEDLEALLEATPAERQTVLFSATLPPRIRAIAQRFLRDPVHVSVGRGVAAPGETLVRQRVYVVQRIHKPAALGRVLDVEAPRAALVFCRTRTEVDELAVAMNARGYRAEALHGGMDQKQRDRVMARLRDGTAELCVATDVAARGLDVDVLTHVVNYDVPSAPESYVHRVGRVGRAGRTGVAITLAEPREMRLVANIERLTRQTLAVEPVPSVADLRARRLEFTAGAVRGALSAEDREGYAGLLAELAREASERDVALAALKLVHEAKSSSPDDQEIPDASHVLRPRRREEGRPGRGPAGGRPGREPWTPRAGGSATDRRSGGSWTDRREGRPWQDRRTDRRPGGAAGGERATGRTYGERPDADRRGGRPAPSAAPERVPAPAPGTAFVFVGIGRRGGVHPGDLVGAIANETGLVGRQIGPIRIGEHFSVVGVPEGAVDTVIAAIHGTTIRGRRAKARRYVEE